MRRVVISIALLLLLLVLFSLNVLTSINYMDEIRNSDEYLIKTFRFHQKYSNKELKQLDIEYLGEVDGYRIYFVPTKNSRSSDPWVKDGFTFPSESHTRIIGIKNGILYVLGKLVHESSIDIKSLRELIQSKF